MTRPRVPRGRTYPPEKRAELIAACIAGEACRAAARRLGINDATAKAWWRLARARHRPVAGGGDPAGLGDPGDPTSPARQAVLAADAVDGWVLRFLAATGDALVSLAGRAADPTWQRGLDGNQFAAVLRSLMEAALAVSDAYERTRGDRSGEDVAGPAETGPAAGGD